MSTARLFAAIRREVRLSSIWLTSSLAWSLAIGVVFVIFFGGL